MLSYAQILPLETWSQKVKNDHNNNQRSLNIHADVYILQSIDAFINGFFLTFVASVCMTAVSRIQVDLG